MCLVKETYVDISNSAVTFFVVDLFVLDNAVKFYSAELLSSFKNCLCVFHVQASCTRTRRVLMNVTDIVMR